MTHTFLKKERIIIAPVSEMPSKSKITHVKGPHGEPCEDSKSWSFIRCREMFPGKCVPKSFRSFKTGKALRVICCPKPASNWNGKRCKVAMKTQTVLYKKKGR